MGTAAPSTLPRGGAIIRAFSPAAPPVPADRVKTMPTTGKLVLHCKIPLTSLPIHTKGELKY